MFFKEWLNENLFNGLSVQKNNMSNKLKTSIRLRPDQKKYADRCDVNISKVCRDALDELMEK